MKSIFFSLTLSFVNKQKHSPDDPYNFMKMANILKTCDDDVERYTKVTFTCQRTSIPEAKNVNA